jgi:DNA polymerase I-like protein with 3'-5' exonuclease and polymerase domains|tara:strand:- start:482 stop:2536 length:2055 start_codon:yes stop_codon:yes gene_type:complete
MKITWLDIETTYKVNEDKKTDADPYTGNMMVSVGYTDGQEHTYLCFYHKEQDPTPKARDTLQSALDNTELLVGHNIKFDLKWLRACGFIYTGKVYDTMIAEYIIHGGEKVPLSLAKCCERYALSPKKSGLIEEYMKKNVSFESIPWDVVKEYGEADVQVTKELYDAQISNMPDSLKATNELMNEFCDVLCDVENNGLQISYENLSEIKTTYTKEVKDLERYLNTEVKSLMGDTPVNLDSPEDRSKIIFSRAVLNKKQWASHFNLGYEVRGNTRKKKRLPTMSTQAFQQGIVRLTKPLFKTVMQRCSSCNGIGYKLALKRDGTVGKQKRICKSCDKKGVIYRPTRDFAGLGMNSRGPIDLTVHGFKTDRPTLEGLVVTSRPEQKTFMESYIRYNAIKTYLKTFIEGIEKGLDDRSRIHPHYMQCVTSTGRLSSRNPNFQNMPRGGTFPVRKVVVSRWEGGHILEGDYAQLEFRVAGFLAKDDKVYEDVRNDVDVHSFTASVLGVSRQEAKADTFKPLYGGFLGTPKQMQYYRAFKQKYKQIAEWHETLQNDAISFNRIVLPSGRYYNFKNVFRMRYGGVSNATAIKNYPVQGFATADLLPIALIKLKKLLTDRRMQSIICNTVHDSIVIDVHPDEQDLAVETMKEAMFSLPEECKKRYNVDYDMPIGIEIKIGNNWLDMKEIYKS